MRFRIEIADLKSNLSEREIEKVIDDVMYDIAENYDEVLIVVMEE